MNSYKYQRLNKQAAKKACYIIDPVLYLEADEIDLDTWKQLKKEVKKLLKRKIIPYELKFNLQEVLDNMILDNPEKLDDAVKYIHSSYEHAYTY